MELNVTNVDEPENSIKRVRVLQFGGVLSTEVPKQKENDTDEKITKLGFASIMSQIFVPTMNLCHFDALELRVRVVCIFYF